MIKSNQEVSEKINKFEALRYEIQISAMQGLETNKDKENKFLLDITLTKNDYGVDNYEDKLGSYLVRLAGHKLSAEEANEVTTLLHIIGDIERISDHACNLFEAAKEIHDKKITFSEQAQEEISVVTKAIKEIVDLSVVSVEKEDKAYAMKIEPLEQVIDKLKFQMKTRHIERLQNNECTIELGFVYSDIITNFERIADHCSNIGVSILQREESGFEPHEYLSHVKYDGENDFISQFDEYKQKYSIK